MLKYYAISTVFLNITYDTNDTFSWNSKDMLEKVEARMSEKSGCYSSTIWLTTQRNNRMKHGGGKWRQ